MQGGGPSCKIRGDRTVKERGVDRGDGEDEGGVGK